MVDIGMTHFHIEIPVNSPDLNLNIDIGKCFDCKLALSIN